MRSVILILSLITVLSGCSMPSTTVKTVDSRPAISIAGAPDGALLAVDGIVVGKAADFNGDPNLLLIEPGTHRIVVQHAGAVLYDQKIFVDGGIKRIVIQ